MPAHTPHDSSMYTCIALLMPAITEPVEARLKKMERDIIDANIAAGQANGEKKFCVRFRSQILGRRYYAKVTDLPRPIPRLHHSLYEQAERYVKMQEHYQTQHTTYIRGFLQKLLMTTDNPDDLTAILPMQLASVIQRLTEADVLLRSSPSMGEEARENFKKDNRKYINMIGAQFVSALVT